MALWQGNSIAVQQVEVLVRQEGKPDHKTARAPLTLL
jgi:hypothetical protein